MDYFTISEVCDRLSVKQRTVRSWIVKIEERTAFRFTRKINMANPHYIYGNPVPQLMLDEEEIKLLEKLNVNRNKGANLSEMIDRLFLLPEDYDQRYPLEQRG